MYKLLIADDEKIERDAIRFIVNENFDDVFDIYEAVNGREAVERAVTVAPDLIFFDIKMPGINGLEAAAQIKDILPECRIIIISAYQDFKYAQEALALRADEYITKPASVDKVVETINKVISGMEEKLAKQRLDAAKEKKLQQIIQYFEDELLVMIAYGEIEEKTVMEYLDILNIQYQVFLAAVISDINKDELLDVEAEILKRSLKKRVVDRLKNFFQSAGYCSFVRSVGQEIYVLLALNQQLGDYEARLLAIRLFSQVREAIFDETGVNLSIGIGNVCSSIGAIYSAFLQAKNSLKYDATPGTVVSFGDIHKGDTRMAYPINKEKRLLQCILQGDSQTATILLDELIKWIQVNTPDMASFKQKVYELLLVSIREIILNTNLNEFDIDTEDLHQNLFVLNHYQEITSLAKEYITRKIQEFNNIKTSRSNALLALAINYLENNFQKDISLEEIAATIQISPSYLSKLFKKTMGENFIDYLTAVRIHKAKEYLTNPFSTIKDVCYQVGYKDPNYFARVFKKICGLTPTEYQAKNLDI